VYRTLIFTLILAILTSGSALAVPIESPPEQDIHGGDVAPAAGAVKEIPPPKIPDATVEMFIREGVDSRFELFFLNVKYDYDVVDFEFYKAWCLEEGKPIRRNAIHKVRLYNCYDPDLPAKFKSMEWNQINYIVNHKNESKKVNQEAIWHFAGSNKHPLSAEAAKLVEDANLNGKEYKPGEGDIIAIICQPEEKKQPVFIEYKLPKAPVEVASAVTELAAASPFAHGWFFPLIPFFPIHHHNPPPPPPPPHPTPEPCTLLLLAFGLSGVLGYRKIRKYIH
jgi:hypothetical protein